MTRKTKTPIDWTAIETAYVSGKLTLKTLAKRHNVAESTINRRSRQFDWLKSRTKYRRKLIGKTVEKQLASDVLTLAAFYKKAESACDIVLKTSHRALVKADKNKHDLPDGNRKHLENIKLAIEVKEKALGIIPATKVIGETVVKEELSDASKAAIHAVMENRETRRVYIDALKKQIGTDTVSMNRYREGLMKGT